MQLARRFQNTGLVEDINNAIEIMEGLTEDNHITAAILNNYRVMIGLRFQRIGSMDDLNRAADVASQAVDITPRDHPDRVIYLNNLGNWLGTRFDRIGSIEDMDQQLLSYIAGWNCETSLLIVRIYTARRAADILATNHDWQRSS